MAASMDGLWERVNKRPKATKHSYPDRWLRRETGRHVDRCAKAVCVWGWGTPAFKEHKPVLPGGSIKRWHGCEEAWPQGRNVTRQGNDQAHSWRHSRCCTTGGTHTGVGVPPCRGAGTQLGCKRVGPKTGRHVNRCENRHVVILAPSSLPSACSMFPRGITGANSCRNKRAYTSIFHRHILAYTSMWSQACERMCPDSQLAMVGHGLGVNKWVRAAWGQCCNTTGLGTGKTAL